VRDEAGGQLDEAGARAAQRCSCLRFLYTCSMSCPSLALVPHASEEEVAGINRHGDCPSVSSGVVPGSSYRVFLAPRRRAVPGASSRSIRRGVGIRTLSASSEWKCAAEASGRQERGREGATGAQWSSWADVKHADRSASCISEESTRVCSPARTAAAAAAAAAQVVAIRPHSALQPAYFLGPSAVSWPLWGGVRWRFV